MLGFQKGKWNFKDSSQTQYPYVVDDKYYLDITNFTNFAHDIYNK